MTFSDEPEPEDELVEKSVTTEVELDKPKK